MNIEISPVVQMYHVTKQSNSEGYIFQSLDISYSFRNSLFT